MSKIDELFEIYDAAWSTVARQTDGDRQSAGRAGIAAVVRALRDAAARSEYPLRMLNETLGSDAGEKKPDPEPDVCVWTPSRAGSDLHTTACGKAIWRCNEHAGICLYCKASIKFTEAKT